MPLSQNLNRRHFLQASAVAAGLTFDTLPLKAQMEAGGPVQRKPASGTLPTGHIGKLEVTRLLCGGNLFSGFAHSENLLYVESLLRHYFTDDKILETLQLCEERGGKMQWIAQTYPTPDNLKENIQLAIDNGAVGAFCMGGHAEEVFVKPGKGELIGEVVAFIKQNGLAAGVGSHLLELPILSEQQKFNPDFYFKTFNTVGYATDDTHDVTALMKTIKKPWIAFKVLGAGRVLPKDGFDLAFKSGADFINVGMYDFQVEPNVSLVRDVVKRHAQRDRPWA